MRISDGSSDVCSSDLSARCEGTELERGEQAVTLELRVVLEDLVDGHARSQQLEEVLHGVAKSTDDWLSVADGRVRGDPVETRHHRERTQQVPSPCLQIAREMTEVQFPATAAIALVTGRREAPRAGRSAARAAVGWCARRSRHRCPAAGGEDRKSTRLN